ncbi:hypothetical protein QBC47DRAFT_430155 [Echria macrotheca]|uniref:Uncharacterized protein n=1 Tax=Echria macrotheca TaxID=438768 RepID=A0AAJ0BB50_9PEZI|nr:hypothetical protein QBC47DRAFT_430155 [Echria macrotheca]
MASGGLPSGAFLTTFNGRRCTAVPRAVTTSAAAPASASVNAVTSAAAAATTTAAAFVAAESANANTALAETFSTSSTSTTSSSSLTSISTSTRTSNLVLNVAAATQVDEIVVAPTAPPATRLPAELPSTPSPTFPTFSVITSAQRAESTPAVETSEADSNITASAADVVANSPAAAVPEVSASPALTESPQETANTSPLNTAQGPAGGIPAEATNTATTNSAVSTVPNPNSGAVQSTVAVAGGVIGGVVAISIAAFLIWWWRRRVIKKRRSTLLTPLDAANYRDEKGGYVINRGSIGPTPVGEKIRAALGYNVKKIRGRMSQLITKKGSAPSVNLDRGNSQFMDVNSHSRATSSATSDRGEVTTKDRFLDWWSRLTADMNFNWRMRQKRIDKDTISIASNDDPREKGGVGSQPDFLTLLSMDERELDREAQRRRASLSRKNGSTGSTDHFLGKLNLSFGNDDPFSDANALAHNSAKPAPLIVSQANNPFSDRNAIKPNTYVADIRRSRGQSVSTTRQPSTVYQRESGGSMGDFAERRNKFRSDPFDLERPELLAGARAAKNSITSSTAGTAGSDGRGSRISGGVGTGDIRRPAGAHTRSGSFTSKYSSGVSMGDWSDPGPDVGPAASRWDGPEPRASPTQGWRDRLEREAAAGRGDPRRSSGGSQKSVGKAM